MPKKKKNHDRKGTGVKIGRGSEIGKKVEQGHKEINQHEANRGRGGIGTCFHLFHSHSSNVKLMVKRN